MCVAPVPRLVEPATATGRAMRGKSYIGEGEEVGMAMQGVRPQGSVVHMARRSQHAGGRWAARRGNGGLDPERMARGLGWFSIGLGVVEILAPRMFARSIGLEGQAA